MRILSFVISTLITVALIFLLDNRWGSIPALGRFLSPQQGFWQNAESVESDRNEHLFFPALKGRATVYLDDRLVPHVFADNDEDVYYVQGFLHAKYRLWQMEFQTMAAAGRVSEILGKDDRFINYDRQQRREGMVFAAENALKALDKDPEDKKYFNAYTSGINAYISSLKESQLPVEYKLLGYKPEPWSNLKIMLFLKMMSKDLAGYEKDLEMTNEKSVFSPEELNVLYPEISDSSIPIVPRDTTLRTAGIRPVPPPGADTAYFHRDTIIHINELAKPNPNNGSNNWAVSGKKTKSGAPILCNDPHLGLSLPSIWYEMQLTTPTMNVYGATFPGSPNVIIGFNDSIAFGFTNAQRDVKDYYQVRFKDASKKEYWFNGAWVPAQQRIEEIKVKGGPSVFDTVAYTVFGPVTYDESFPTQKGDPSALALRWMAHDPSNEGAVWVKLDRAKNYQEYLEAIKTYDCPGQNMLFASRSGDIAIWQQGKFPARWNGQGLYVMPGYDSSYMWQGFIPQQENPHVINPPEGFIESANQRPVDSTYPYYIPGNYIVPRGVTISKRLSGMQDITPKDMMALQNDYYSFTASEVMPLLLHNLEGNSFNEKENEYLNEMKRWNFIASADSKAATIYQAVFDSLKNGIWDDEFSKLGKPVVMPEEQTLIEALIRDSTFKYIDDIRTPRKETLKDIVVRSFRLAAQDLQREERENGLVWWKHKNPSIYHLLRTAVLPFGRTGIEVGGMYNTINAITTTHGPSWRMIVQLSSPVEAYGVYPGGQSGNPGSPFYENFIDTWATGHYYTLWFMKPSEGADKRIIGILVFEKA